ncbi:MAG: TetR/AcrR family transcriptional regulator [Gemmatimonadaceae bacterium]
MNVHSHDDTVKRAGARPRALPTKQARSRETLDRLLEAAEAVLAEEGLDAATVPGIAGRAGLSVGVVYRRFPDKDALMRAVYERFFARSLDANREALDPARWEGVSAADAVRAVIRGLVHGYRRHRGLLRALLLYAQTHPDRDFRRRADAMNTETLRELGALILARGGEIAHPRPEAATEFGVLVIAAALNTLLLPEERRTAPFASDEALATELARMYLGYLGLPDGGAKPARRQRTR